MVCQQLFSKVLTFLIPPGTERRRRDLNPRAAINDLHPFQGCPFSLLGTSPNSLTLKVNILLSNPDSRIRAERMGFEPMRPWRQTVFKTAPLWPLRYLSILFRALLSAGFILSPLCHNVNRFLQIFLIFLKKDIFHLFPTYLQACSSIQKRLKSSALTAFLT